MGLIDSIDAGLIRAMAGGSSSRSSGSSASSSGPVDLSTAVERFGSAFQSSAVRIQEARSAFLVAEDALAKLLDIADSLVTLAEQSADVQTSDEERRSLNTQFRNRVGDFRKILADAERDDIDLLDKSTLARVLEVSGIDTGAATKLAAAFQQASRSDPQLGHRYVEYDEEALIEPPSTLDFASTGRDPLDNNISTRANAIVTGRALKKLRADIQNDQSLIGQVNDELRSAQEFAVAGFRAAQSAGLQLGSISSAQELAATLVTAIKRNARDGNISEHSSLDGKLSVELLG